MHICAQNFLVILIDIYIKLSGMETAILEECFTIFHFKVKEILKMIGADGITIMDLLLLSHLLFILTSTVRQLAFP